MINCQTLFSKKSLIVVIFIAFSVFWFGDFAWIFGYMVGFPVVFYFYEKNNSTIENITDNHSYVTFATTIIIVFYIVFLVHYLSIQNPNKVFDKNNLIIDTYYIPEYKSVRTRSDSQLWVQDSNGRETINCSIIKYGRCPYAYEYGKNIDIGFVKIRKNFYRFISGRDKPSVAYYIKFDDEVVPSEYFIQKYDSEMKQVYLFLISLNLYMVFLYYIKKSYGFNLRKSFSYAFSDKKEIKKFIWNISFIIFYSMLLVFL